MKSNLKQIQDFLKNKKIGFVGASRNPRKFGSQVFRHLVDQDYAMVPVHHEADQIEGEPCVSGIDQLPDDVYAICLLTPKDITDELLKQALEKGIQHIWIQQFSDGPQTRSLADAGQANVITGRCLFMYTHPEGLHQMHERMAKLFRVYAN